MFLGALAYGLASGSGAAIDVRVERPDVVFLLLDTTSAARMSAWGNPRRTTPNIDTLAGTGVRFARHFANSHATRPSMPQLMSGRYYQSSILRAFRPRTHPRDWPFTVRDPTIALLPEILDATGYQLLAVSAHPWVARESRLGAPFDVFEEPTVPARRGHADASVLVDRALALWQERPHDRPSFLYLHFMDPHIPRHVAPGQLRFGTEDAVARARFDAAGEPAMDDPWHEWDRSDARAFTPRDVAFFTAVYDTILARLDDEVGRLLEAIRDEDPGLQHTLIVLTADHGEELGAHGRISHEASLDDAVQHVPWILAGTNVAPGQTAWGVTEHVDVLPTLLDAIDVTAPSPVRFDGRSVMADGRVCGGCLRAAPVYAWEDYRGVRLGRKLLRQQRTDSFAERCTRPERVLGPERRTDLPDPETARGGARILSRTLDVEERRFRVTRYSAAADRPFSVLPPFWRLAGDPVFTCLDAGPQTPRSAFGVGGWIWTGRGLLVLADAPRTPPLSLLLEIPDGDYDVDLGVRDVPPPPRFFGYGRWLRKRLRRREPKDRIHLGRFTAAGERLRVDVPATLAAGRHLLAVHVRPAGHEDDRSNRAESDPALRERLRSLGYVD